MTIIDAKDFPYNRISVENAVSGSVKDLFVGRSDIYYYEVVNNELCVYLVTHVFDIGPNNPGPFTASCNNPVTSAAVLDTNSPCIFRVAYNKGTEANVFLYKDTDSDYIAIKAHEHSADPLFYSGIKFLMELYECTLNGNTGSEQQKQSVAPFESGITINLSSKLLQRAKPTILSIGNKTKEMKSVISGISSKEKDSIKEFFGGAIQDEGSESKGVSIHIDTDFAVKTLEFVDTYVSEVLRITKGILALIDVDKMLSLFGSKTKAMKDRNKELRSINKEK